jgi:branched-chain amino acid transport system permease protein
VWARHTSRGIWVLGFVLVAAVPFWLPGLGMGDAGGDLYTATLVAIGAVFASGVSFTLGWSGVANFGAQLSYGAGAYAVAYLAALHGFQDFILLLVCGALAGLGMAFVQSIFVGEKTGFAFGMITLALGELGFLFVNQTNYLYGTNGIAGVPRGSIFGIGLTSSAQFYLVAVVCVALTVLLIGWLRRTVLGRSIAAARQDPRRALAVGLPTRRCKVIGLCVGGLIAGVAGGLYAMAVGVVDPSLLDWTMGAAPVLAGLIGGIGTLAGPVIGAIIYQSLSTGLATMTTSYVLWTGVGTLFIFMLFPGGLVAVGRQLSGDWLTSLYRDARRRIHREAASRGHD